jgi:hypothetical protein
MNNLHNERYDEIKSLIKKSKLIFEQSTSKSSSFDNETLGRINVARGIESRIEDDEREYETSDTGLDTDEGEGKERNQKYRISGGILSLHGKDKTDLDITSDDKLAFQETMDEFIDEVADLVDFNTLNVYPNNVEWSGHLIDEDIDFILTIGEDSGIYIQGEMIKVDQNFLDLIAKLQQYYQKFKSKWAKTLAVRKKTRESNE